MFQRQSCLNQAYVYLGKEKQKIREAKTKGESKDSIHIQKAFLGLFLLTIIYTKATEECKEVGQFFFKDSYSSGWKESKKSGHSALFFYIGEK